MNKKTRRLLPRIALLLALVVVAACVLSSCGSNTVIDTKTTAEEWAEKEVSLTPEKNWLGHILSWIGIFLGWITKVMPANSYILTLFIFAIIMEIVLLPFSIKQQKNSIRQAKLRPKEMAIENKYKGRNDQPTMQKMQQEIQELYQRENFSPYSGCLPLLIQLPIIMALYSIIIDPLHYVMGQTAGMSQALTTFATASRAAGGLGCVFGNTNGSIKGNDGYVRAVAKF